MTIKDKKVVATWRDKSTSFLADVTEDELKEMQKAEEKHTHERFSLGEKEGALSCHLQNGGTAVKIFFWPPPPAGSEKAPKQNQVCQILTNLWSDLDPEKAQEAALKMGNELINDIVLKKYRLEDIKSMKTKKERAIKDGGADPTETAGGGDEQMPEAGDKGTSAI